MNAIEWVETDGGRFRPLAILLHQVNGDSAKMICEDDTTQRARCRVCKKPAPRFGRLPKRSIRDLDCDGRMVYPEFCFPRVECSEHGVVMAFQTFFEPHSSFTIAFEDYALRLVSDNVTQTEVAKRLRVTRNVLGRILDRGYRRRRKDRLKIEGRS